MKKRMKEKDQILVKKCSVRYLVMLRKIRSRNKTNNQNDKDILDKILYEKIVNDCKKYDTLSMILWGEIFL